jgi:hypothetical protein
MLVVILACLGPAGYRWNLSVWPWNIYLFLVEFVLFYKSSFTDENIRFEFNAPTLGAIALFSLAPALSLFGWWHSFPAFKLYSGNFKNAEVILAQDEDIMLLPKNLGQWVDHHRLALANWTTHEFEMIAYPESYVFRRGAAGLCPYLKDAQKAKLRIYEAPVFYSINTPYQDFPLCQAEVKACPIE